jgi:hypothetical protein
VRSKLWRTVALAAATTIVLVASPQLSAMPATAAGWDSTQNNVPLGDPGCSSGSRTATAVALTKEWDYWDSCGGTEVSTSSSGLSATPWGGSHVFRWRKPAGSSQVYQKLNRTFTKDNWPGGSAGPNVPNTGSPANVSGRYVTYRYMPSSDLVLNPSHGWFVAMSFKENYLDANGNWHQDGTGWKVGCNNFTSGYRGIIRCGMTANKSFALASYTNRWVKWEYRVYQGSKDTTGHGGRIELWLDDKLMDTGYESQSHVGSAAFAPLSRTRAWVWVVGQYSSNQITNGVPDYQNTHLTSYVGRSTVTPY